MKQSFGVWLLIYLGWFLLIGTATFHYFQFYPSFHSYNATHQFWQQHSLLDGISSLGWEAMLLLWIYCSLAMLMAPTLPRILHTKIHLGLFTIWPIAELLTLLEDIGSPFAGLDVAILELVLWMLLAEFCLMLLAYVRLRVSPFRHIGSPLLLSGMMFVFVGGWFAGLAAHSAVGLYHIIQAAETIAQGKPYCLDNPYGAVTSRFDLAGFKLHPNQYGPWVYDPAALLVIEDGTNRTYRYWSRYLGVFVATDFERRTGPHRFNLDYVRCKPKPHAAVGLKFWPDNIDQIVEQFR